MSTERRHHTGHGLHFNKKGRDWIVNNIIKEIRNWKSSCRVSSPIELPWKNETKDLVTVSVEKKGPNPNCKNDDHPESEDSAAKVGSVSISRTVVEWLGQTSKIDNGQQEEITIRKSTRLKQLPSNKYQDFYVRGRLSVNGKLCIQQQQSTVLEVQVIMFVVKTLYTMIAAIS